MLEQLSRNLFHDLWDLKDGSIRMRCYRDLLKTQWSARGEIQQQQIRALRAIVAYARANVPWYRRQYADLPDVIHSPQLLPILEKSMLQEVPEQLISEEFTESDLVEARTGGSTGKPLRVLFDIRTQERRNAAEARSNDWAGARLGIAQIALWGNPKIDFSIKGRLRHNLLDRLSFIDTVGFDDNSAQEFVDTWLAEDARVIFGHAHSIYLLAQYLEKSGEQRIRPKAIISTSMSLLKSQRRLIESVFHCEVSDRYGCEEVGLIGSQCEAHENFHINMDHVLVEIVDDNDQPCPPGQPGQILVTDLCNRGMPLLRYRVGDIATLSEDYCSCGRESLLLENIGGRIADFLLTRDYTHVAGISLIERTLTAFPGLAQMQVVQEELDRFEINYVPADNFQADCLGQIRQEFEVVFGAGIKVNFTAMKTIPQQKSGKYRFSICKVNYEL